MIGLIIVTHGRLAEELRLAMEHVVGPQRSVATICIGVDDDVEQRRADIQARIEEVDAGDGVILLTDMFGGTPSNLAISMMGRGQVEVIAGVNLPMLVKLAKVRSRQALPECVDIAEAAGKKYIAAASHVLTTCKTPNLCMSLDPRKSNAHLLPVAPAAGFEANANSSNRPAMVIKTIGEQLIDVQNVRLDECLGAIQRAAKASA